MDGASSHIGGACGGEGREEVGGELGAGTTGSGLQPWSPASAGPGIQDGVAAPLKRSRLH